VTDTGLKSLSRLPDLKELNLRSCDNVSDIGMGFLANSGVPSPLVKLDVSFCDRVTDSSMAHLASGITNLSSLSMSACTITDGGLGRICKDLAGLWNPQHRAVQQDHGQGRGDHRGHEEPALHRPVRVHQAHRRSFWNFEQGWKFEEYKPWTVAPVLENCIQSFLFTHVKIHSFRFLKNSVIR